MSINVDPSRDPFEIFADALRAAEGTGIKDPNAMAVSSVGADGRPSSRMVLLKDFDEHGFVFYTNYESRKGREIQANPNVCLHFFWRELGMQVLVEGPANPVSDEEADAYFATRPHGSQVGAWASRQSRPLKGRAELLAAVAEVKLKHPGRVPRPPHWSGFRISPTRFEFWKDQPFRLHDRTAFARADASSPWETSKLFP